MPGNAARWPDVHARRLSGYGRGGRRCARRWVVSRHSHAAETRERTPVERGRAQGVASILAAPIDRRASTEWGHGMEAHA
jgi:hypothetical protein